ncbi:MAG TPA: alpha/beta fold hydrolase [Terriglobales bacterium]|nr:alpha/beta fold hydrolase [Terriglobales bacterium]
MNICDSNLPTEHLSCEGSRVECRHAGSGEPVVLVHGLLGYSFSWRSVIPLLTHDWEVFAPDMPGAGFSECRADLDCRLGSAAHRLLALLDAAGIRSCHLVGSSYGGATAVLAAGLAPSRIRSLTLVSPANPWSRIGRKRLALLRNPVMAHFFPKMARSVHPVHRYFVRRMWGDPRRITEETLEGYSRPLIRAGIFEHSVKIVRTWKADMAQLEAMLPKIASIPTLLVWGSKDRVVDPSSAKFLSQALRGARIEIIEGAGHLPYEECPEEFCRILQEFLHSARAQPVKGSVRDVT